MEDKKLTCKDCGKEFVFTVGEQEFYQSKGFENEPTRCADCRRAKKRAAQPVPQKSLLKKESTGQRRSFYLSRAENFAFSPLKKSAMSSVSRIFTAR